MTVSRRDDEDGSREARRDLLDRARRLETVAGLLYRDLLLASPGDLPRIEQELVTMEGRGEQG